MWVEDDLQREGEGWKLSAVSCEGIPTSSQDGSAARELEEVEDTERARAAALKWDSSAVGGTDTQTPARGKHLNFLATL